MHLQLMADAAAIDAKAANGHSIEPLCGLPLAVKDSIDVLGYPTTASTPALLSKLSSDPRQAHVLCLYSWLRHFCAITPPCYKHLSAAMQSLFAWCVVRLHC